MTTEGSSTPGLPGPESTVHATQAGLRVTFVYGKSKSVHVYKDENGKVQWEVDADELSPVQAKVHYRYDELKLRVKQCIGKLAREEFEEQLAQALFHGLSAPDDETASGFFAPIAESIDAEAQRRARVQYLTNGSIAAVVVISAALLTAHFSVLANVTSIALAAAAGAAGAWASVLQRVWKLELAPRETPGHLILQGATRILVGAMFSVAALAAMKANLLVPGAVSNPWSLGLATFTAGMSERLIPEVLGKVEANLGT